MNITLNGIEYAPVKAIETPVTRTTIVAQETPEALDVSDVNNVLGRFTDALNKQNIKGIQKYETSLTDAKLSELELIEHVKQEIVDAWQYVCVLEDKLNDQTGNID